jgi:ribulose-phosphate 3-epimerase
MITIVPAIIPHTKEQLEEEINKVSGFAGLVQIDISDGIFTPVKTWPYNEHDLDFFDKLRAEEVGWPKWDNLDFEVHLMIKNPEEVVQDWISTGISTIVAHIETTDNFQKIIDICRENMVSIGVAIKPSTDISRLEKFIPYVDFIQVMGNDMLGRHGMELENKAVEMIKKLHMAYPSCIIGIDIGVTKDTAKELISAGATKLISGSAILDADSPKEEYDYLMNIK